MDPISLQTGYGVSWWKTRKGAESMKAKDIMTPHVELIHSDDSIKKAARKMEELNVGALPVAAGGEVVGIITDRDIVIRSVAQGLDPEKHKIMEAVSEGIVSCHEEDDLKTVADIMERNQIRRVIVKNQEANVTGIVSLGDLATNIHKEMAGEVIKEVSEPSQPAR
jgi:CBS domain-containing protein